MTLAKKPFKIHPYDEMRKYSAPWLDKYTDIVKSIISDYERAIRAEAESDGIPDFADEDFVYERFVDNCQYHMRNANWEVLKYFHQIFRMKIFHDMIGEWKFTVNDVEMYNYFRNMEVTPNTNCKPSRLRFKTDNEVATKNVNEFLCYAEFTFTYHPGRINVPFVDLFRREFSALNAMISNVRCQKNTVDDGETFFTTHGFHCYGPEDYQSMPQRRIDSTEVRNDVAIDFYKQCAQNSELVKAIETFLNAEQNLGRVFAKAYKDFEHVNKEWLPDEKQVKINLLNHIRYHTGMVDIQKQ